MKYKIVACGGTFDYLHKGHKEFLRFVLSAGEKTIIGLTSDAFAQQYKLHSNPYSFRKKTLEDFLQKEHLLQRVKIILIDDIYGPTLDRHNLIEALVVTAETEKGADAINEERKKNGLSPLPIISMPVLTSQNYIISSSNIRKGIMNQEGIEFIHPSYFSHTFHLPENLREQLRKPFGMVLKNGMDDIKKLNPQRIVTIGDITTSKFNEKNVQQKISVIDFIVERKKSFDSVKQLGFTGNEEIISLINPAGMITQDTWKKIINVIERIQETKRFILAVSGEEDLVFIPLLLALPLDYHLFYGQPHEGLVWVEVTLENKEKAYRLFRQFERRNL